MKGGHRRGSLALGSTVRGPLDRSCSLLGAAAFPGRSSCHAHGSPNQAHAGDAPWMMARCILLLLARGGARRAQRWRDRRQGRRDARGAGGLRCRVAASVPAATAGFEPVFFLLFPAGYVLGRRFGFLLGALTLFASALVTGGVGPWLPFQMLAAGWMGYGAGMLPQLAGRCGRVLLPLYAGLACLVYGALLNLWFWPFGTGTSTTLSFEPGAAEWHNVAAFCSFDLTTSLGFDIPRAALNAVLILIAGRPVMAALRREPPCRIRGTGGGCTAPGRCFGCYERSSLIVRTRDRSRPLPPLRAARGAEPSCCARPSPYTWPSPASSQYPPPPGVGAAATIAAGSERPLSEP